MLSNNYMAVNGGDSATIDIIDTEHYQGIKEMDCKGYIGSSDDWSSHYLLHNIIFNCL